jgi:hypothetical protein
MAGESYTSRYATLPRGLNRWSGSAPFWGEAPRNHPAHVAPITQALVEDGQSRGQHSVLDVATGPGEPATLTSVRRG